MFPVICMPIYDTVGKLNMFPAGVMEVQMSMGKLELNSGKYNIMVAVMDSGSNEVLTRVQGFNPFRVISDRVQWAKLVRHVVPYQIDVLTPPL